MTAALFTALMVSHLAAFVYDLLTAAQAPFAAFYDAALVSAWTVVLVSRL